VAKRARFVGTTSEEGTVLAIELVGELDLGGQSVARELLARFDPQHHSVLALDLTRLDFCDSTSVTLFLAAHRRAAPFDATVRLTVVEQGPVHRILALVGATSVLDVVTVPPVADVRELRSA
jgi:anti-sigma B factor antagonist